MVYRVAIVWPNASVRDARGEGSPIWLQFLTRAHRAEATEKVGQDCFFGGGLRYGAAAGAANRCFYSCAKTANIDIITLRALS
jgi:hypothetical protein